MFIQLFWAAARFLLPALAAVSIASDLEQRRIGELILAGLKPVKILIAKGMAAMLPFLVLGLLLFALHVALACLVPSLVIQGASVQPAAAMRSGSGYVFRRDVLDWPVVWNLFCIPLAYIANISILVCLSAICRRVTVALVACYSTEFLMPLVTVWGLRAVVGQVFPTHLDYENLLRPVCVLAIEFTILVVLIPQAMKALERSDEVPTTPMHP